MFYDCVILLKIMSLVLKLKSRARICKDKKELSSELCLKVIWFKKKWKNIKKNQNFTKILLSNTINKGMLQNDKLYLKLIRSKQIKRSCWFKKGNVAENVTP